MLLDAIAGDAMPRLSYRGSFTYIPYVTAQCDNTLKCMTSWMHSIERIRRVSSSSLRLFLQLWSRVCRNKISHRSKGLHRRSSWISTFIIFTSIAFQHLHLNTKKPVNWFCFEMFFRNFISVCYFIKKHMCRSTMLPPQTPKTSKRRCCAQSTSLQLFVYPHMYARTLRS